MVQALEALGQSLESHFHTLLPGLVRLLPVVNQSMTPMQTKRRILKTLSTLLPRMRLAPYASTIIHPLIRTISLSRIPEVRVDALNTICNVSVAIGPSLSLFVPTIQSVLSQMKVPQPERWRNIMCTLAKNEAPCIMDVDSRWDDANGWGAEMDNILYRMPIGEVPENKSAALLRGMPPARLCVSFVLFSCCRPHWQTSCVSQWWLDSGIACFPECGVFVDWFRSRGRMRTDGPTDHR